MLMKGIALISCLLAAGSASVAATGHSVVIFAPPALWSGLPTDDDGDGNGAYDRRTGLNVSVNCFANHVLQVQYSSTRKRAVRFYADVIPKSQAVKSAAVPLRVLSPANPMMISKSVVKTCGKEYAIFVAYPK